MGHFVAHVHIHKPSLKIHKTKKSIEDFHVEHAFERQFIYLQGQQTQ